MSSTRYSYPILMEVEFFSTGFRKIPKYQISLKSVYWEPICSIRTDERTDRHAVKSHFSQLFEIG